MEHSMDIDAIVTKYLREEALSSEERSALHLWISQGQGRSEMLENLKNEPNSTKANLAHMEEVPHARIWEKFESRLQQEGYWRDEDRPAMTAAPVIGSGRASRYWLRYVIAASLLLIAAGGAWWTMQRKPAATETVARASKPADVSPGGNRATLTLADGHKINLDSSANGVLASQGNTKISKLSDGQLAYNKSSEEKPLNIVFNILSTPRAGQFSLALPDGTKVWLNNASSLRYPVAFAGNTREVDLSGEAYFEVAKDVAHPFLVHTTNGPAGPATVEVLGTSFNIMAYSDENTERATLVDGSIRYIHGMNTTLLKPEEQSVLEANGNLKTLKHVNVAEITAWKNGYFHFDHANLETTMRQLARWYDISVEYQGSIPSQEFVGKIQRSMPLSVVLKGLEGEHVHFQLRNKKLTVLP